MKLHPKYGINSTMTTCFICGEVNEILLVGAHTNKLRKAGIASKDGEIPSKIGALNKEPCQKCKEHMKQGIILISVRDGESGDNPYRTGNWVVVKKKVAKKIFDKKIMKAKIAFVEDSAWKKLFG